MTYRDALAALEAAIPSLSAKSQEFANSLLAQAVRNAEMGNAALSQNQWHWVRKLAETKPAATQFPAAAKLDFTAVAAMFATASKAKKFPKIRLQLDDGRAVVLALASAKASRPGTVNVTDGRPFGDNVWYGRVDPTTGAWEASNRADAATMTAVTALLTRFAADPLTMAADYGHATHSCCFCGITLTDPRSKTAGYGPICAGKFGLDWGSK